MNLADILRDSDYKLSQFTTAEIEQLEQTITLKATKNGEVPYTVCLVRKKAIKLTHLGGDSAAISTGFDTTFTLSAQSHSGRVWSELWAGSETRRHCGDGQRPS